MGGFVSLALGATVYSSTTIGATGGTTLVPVIHRPVK